MATKAQITLTERALFARLSRALAKEGKALRRCRQDMRAYNELGDVYCINTEKNLVEAKHIDIAKWAREMKILKEWETVEA